MCIFSYLICIEESSKTSTLSSTSADLKIVDQTTISVLGSSEAVTSSHASTDPSYMCQGAVSGETWSAPSGWTGPCAGLYYSFDVSDLLILMEGTQQMDSPSIVFWKVIE